MGFNMQKLMQQAQKMQRDMAKVQENLGNMQFEGKAGGGMVTAVCNGNSELLGIRIDPQVLDPDDVEMLEDMVLAAVREAITASKEAAAQAMGKITGGAGLPGMF